MALFRTVELPEGVPGVLHLHRMPGFEDSLDQIWAEAQAAGLFRIVCLATPEEVQEFSADYAAAIATASCPCPVRLFPISDRGVPEDEHAFWDLSEEIAELLRDGKQILIHCWYGIGRTGTLATAVLLRLGLPLDAALQRVVAGGSHPESGAQRALLRRLATEGPSERRT